MVAKLGIDCPWDITPIGATSGCCACCGDETRRIWGYVISGEYLQALYFVTWTLTRFDHGARIDLVIGPWGNGTTPADRQCILLDLQFVDERPQVMICDSDGQMEALAARGSMRSDLLGTLSAEVALRCCDTIWLRDGRLVELRGDDRRSVL